MKSFFTASDISNDTINYASRWKKENQRPVIGYFCSYTPEEIIHASGALPFRILGHSGTYTLADSHLQAYSCSLVRGCLEEALSGKLSFLDGTVFPHTCDSIQRLSDIWRLNSKIPLHLDVVLPVKLNTASAREYMIKVLHKFRRDLSRGLGVTISEDSLMESITLYNAIRATFMELYDLRSTYPELVKGGRFLEMIRCSMCMDRSDFLTALTEYRDEIKKLAQNHPPGSNKRILVAGGICNHPDFYSIVEESGGAVAYDDLCTGSRLYTGTIASGNDPVEAIAQRYLERVVCPAKHSCTTSRGENLIRLVKEHNIEGVIFLFLKFCDPQSFDYPYLKECMDKEGVLSILLEIEDRLPSEGQLRTRFETFISML